MTALYLLRLLLFALATAAIVLAVMEGLLSTPPITCQRLRQLREANDQPAIQAAPPTHHYLSPPDLDGISQPLISSAAVPRTCNRTPIGSLSSVPGPLNFCKPAAEVVQHQWVRELEAFLRKLPSCDSLVSVVCCTFSYTAVLLNWLISATLRQEKPLTNILVIALDPRLHLLMTSRGFYTVLVPPETVVRSSAPELKEHSAVFLTRLTVLRLINSLGYSAVHYDTDTVILRNPEALFARHKRSDVVGSIGWWPYTLSRRPPGFTVCMGVILFRSTPQTDMLWDKMSTVKLKMTYAQDDQIRLNYALKLMAVKWRNMGNTTSITPTGRGQNGFQVTALPTNLICRGDLTCKQEYQSMYYVWHGKGGKSGLSKKESVTRSGLWFLRSDWKDVSRDSTARGTHWLRLIAL